MNLQYLDKCYTILWAYHNSKIRAAFKWLNKYNSNYNSCEREKNTHCCKQLLIVLGALCLTNCTHWRQQLTTELFIFRRSVLVFIANKENVFFYIFYMILFSYFCMFLHYTSFYMNLFLLQLFAEIYKFNTVAFITCSHDKLKSSVKFH